MRLIKLFAGLGNQLFQYAYGLYLRSQGESVQFILSSGPGTITDVFDLDDPGILSPRNGLIAAFIKARARYLQGGYEVGFFQELRYAAALSRKDGFLFRRRDAYLSSTWINDAMDPESVSVHVRGGDYRIGGAAEVYGAVCGPLYYSRAITKVAQRLKNPRFLVFTDDPEYSAAILRNVDHPLRYVSESKFLGDSGFDLFLMSQCKHHVIANSTFSWWGAFLGSGKGRITICPDRWTAGRDVDLASLIPTEWMRVST